MAVAKETITALEKQFRCITVCSLCQRTFTNPKILPCFHSFCLYCLKENATRYLQSGTTPNCPTCKIDFEIPKQGVDAIPTNEYLDRIIATADALSSTLQIASFERTEGYDPYAADRSHMAYRRHDYGGGRSTTEIGQSIKSRGQTGRVCLEESRQGYVSDKMQRMCQKHMLKFDNYCSHCTRVICQLCTKTEHRSHPVISVALATNELRQMIDSYLNGVISCIAYYRAQTNLCETDPEGRAATAIVNQMYSTRERPDSRGNVKSGRHAMIQTPLQSGSTCMDLVKRRETSACLVSWKEYVKRFYEEITTRGCKRSDICKIAKELNKLHDSWRNSYKQESLAQQTQNSNSLCARNNTSIGDIDNRHELEEKEQRIQKLLRKQMEWMANEKRLKDIINRQREENIQMEANLKEQELEYEELKMERDWFAGELQIAKAKSKPSITAKLLKKKISPTHKVSPTKQTLKGGSIIHQVHFVNKQQKLLDQMKEMEEYHTKKEVIWDEKEEQLIREIKRLESLTNATHKQHEKSKIQLLELLKEKIEWMDEKELCSDSLKQFKIEKKQWEASLKEQQESNVDIQMKLTQQLQNETRLVRELEQLISWIERIDTQPGEFQTTKGSCLENGIIEKLKVSIIKKTKLLSEKQRLLLDRNEDLSHRMEELKLGASVEQMTQKRKSSHITKKEHECSVIIKKLEDQLTEQLQNEKRLDRELEQLISWIEQIDKLAKFQMTERDSENSIIKKLRVSIIKKAKELSEKESLLFGRNEDLNHRMEELKSRASSDLMALQLKNSSVAKNQHAYLIREKQGADKIHELESQIDQLNGDLTQQQESNRTVQGELEAALRREGYLTAELGDFKQRLGLADKKQEDDTGVLRELTNLIKWIERWNRQPTEDQVTSEGESENSIIKKIKALIIEATKQLTYKDKQLLQTIEESGQQITVLQQRLATEEANQRKLDKQVVSERDKLIQNIQLLNKDKKLLIARVQELEHQVTELQQSLTSEQKMHQTSLCKSDGNLHKQLWEKDRIHEAQVKQHYDEIHDLQNEILKLREELRQQEGQYLADKKQEDDTPLLRELQNLINWMDRGDIQPTEEQMTIEGKSENSIIWKIKASISKTTKELRDKEKQLLQTIEESDRQINELRQILINEENNHQKLGKEFASERDKLMENVQLLRNGEKQLIARVHELEHQVTELQHSLTSEQQVHQTALRISEASLHKQLREKDRIYVAEIKRLNDEILQLQEVLQQRVEQNNSSRKKLAITGVTDLKQPHMNTKNTYDNSAAVQIAASRKPTLPTGISNVGNTCYFGATIQNLVHTFLLSEELHPSKQSPTDVEQLLTKAYIEFISSGYKAKCDQTFRLMYMEFCKKSSRFADRGQHDSHDLFVNFLNCLRDEERRRFGSVNSPGFRNVLTAVDKVFGGHTITVYVCSTCKTPYHVCEPFLDISVPILGPTDGGEDEEEDLFVNHLRNPQSIGGHDPVRQAVETTMKPLGVRSGLKTPQRIFEKRSLMSESTGDISLKQCLVYYSRTEQIHNEYLCNPCETAGRPSMTSALKRTLIYNPPAVLVLHLKRFEQTTVGFKKCNQRVTYDEYLDIGPYCSSSCLRMREPDDANIWYSLYGVVVHKGSLTSGHYVAYIKDRDCDMRRAKQFMQQTFLNRDQVLNEDDIRRINASRGMVRSRKEWEPREVEGQWYLADDEYVKAVEKTEALSQEAYLLFYERVAK